MATKAIGKAKDKAASFVLKRTVEGHAFATDNRAQTNNFMNKGVNMAVGLLVVGLLTAYLLPIAISEIAGVDTSTWGSAEAQLFGLLPIFFVLGILLFVVSKATDKM